jgi:nucleoside-diphosphate-sugar epimerase
MPPIILAVGLTGYAGGDILSHLISLHPSWHIRAIVRSPPSNAHTPLHEFQSLHPPPSLTLIPGTLDSLELLTTEAASADLILQMADGDHEAGTIALLHGLAAGKKGTYIHISGAANLIDLSKPFGALDEKIYGDEDNAHEILTLPHERFHAALEQKIISESERLGVKTAIVSPPAIFGTGRGPGRKEGFGGVYLEAVVKHGKAFVVNEGENAVSSVHVEDISSAVEILAVAALAALPSAPMSPSSLSSSVPATPGWNKEGYYFVTSSEAAFKTYAAAVAVSLHKRGLLDTDEIDHLGPQAVKEMHPYALIMWGANVRARTQKLRALGWGPREGRREEAVDEAVAEWLRTRKE